MILQPLLNVGKNILDVMVARHIPTMWIIFVGINILELLDLGSEVDIRWAIRLFRFIVLLESVHAADHFDDTLGSPIIYKKISDMNQYIFPVSLPYR